jgi:hypothetical protein
MLLTFLNSGLIFSISLLFDLKPVLLLIIQISFGTALTLATAELAKLPGYVDIKNILMMNYKLIVRE